MNYWSKSVLSVYKYLESMSNSIDKKIKECTTNSKDRQKYQTTLYQMGKIISYIERKRKIINLKVIIEDVLNNLDNDEMRILILSYIDGVTSEKISQILDCSLRTFFRKKSSAIKNFSDILVNLGYDEKYFNTEYKCEPWLMSVYNETLSKNNNEVINNTVIKQMFNEITNVAVSVNSMI